MQRAIILAHLRGDAEAQLRPWYDIFTLVDGDPTHGAAARFVWATPWWTWPELKVRFFRPVAAATLYFDYALFGERYWLMHLHSVLWYAAACFAVTAVVLRVSRDRLTGLLGALLFAVDDAHATAAGWLAGRNAVIGLTLIATSFCLYVDDCKRERSSWRLAASLAGVLLALLAAENVVSALPLFFAYSALFDRRGLRSRVGPPLLIAAGVVGWLLTHKALGFGSLGSGAYLDPIADWDAFWRALPERYLQLLRIQLGAPWALALHLPGHWLQAVEQFARWVLLPALLVFVARNVDRDREVTFWSVSAALGLIPLAAAWPHDRLLTHVGVAWSMLLAHLIIALVRTATGRLRFIAFGQWTLTAILVMLHVALAPIALALSSNPRFAPEIAARNLDREPGWWSRQVIFVNVPTLMLAYAMNWERMRLGLPLASRVAVLGATDQEVEVTRLDTHTLELYTPPGFLLESFSSSWRGARAPLHVGDAIVVADYVVQVTRVTADGRPIRVRFRFGRALDDQQFMFVYWNGRELAPFHFAPVGQRSIIRAALDNALLMPAEEVR